MMFKNRKFKEKVKYLMIQQKISMKTNKKKMLIV